MYLEDVLPFRKCCGNNLDWQVFTDSGKNTCLYNSAKDRVNADELFFWGLT